jgi:Domain of unknown function (DUF4936)
VRRALFIYWKIDPDALPAALERVREAQAALRARWPGLETALWQRAEPDGAQATVMETYAAPDGIDDDARARIESALAAALAGQPAGTRHVEAFSPA